MLSLYQFNVLPEDEKLPIIWNDGVHVADRHKGKLSILRYQVCSFYVEVWYKGDANAICRIRFFFNTEQLEPYLQQMDITKFFSDVRGTI